MREQTREKIIDFADRVEDRMGNASIGSRIALVSGGAALDLAGAVLKVKYGEEVAGTIVETVGAAGIIAGAAPGILRFMGMEPPRQNGDSNVE